MRSHASRHVTSDARLYGSRHRSRGALYDASQPQESLDFVIRHIVAFQLTARDEPQRSRDAAEFIDRLEALRDVVAGVLDLHVHRDVGLVAGHWPLLLVADFESLDVLNAYQSHPRHVAFISWANAGIVSERAVVDFVVAPDL